MRRALLLLGIALSTGGGCADSNRDAREDEIVGVIARADFSLIVVRPELIAGKYARMASGPVAFYRGTLALFRHDVTSGATHLATSRFALDAPLVPSLGDPHPENFGALRASDGSLALEPNDLDAADRAPYAWDLRRLVAGLVAFTNEANNDDMNAKRALSEGARSIAARAAEAYVEGLDRALSGDATYRITDPTTSPIVADIFERSERDHAARAALTALTVEDGGVRVLRRGAIDPDDRANVLLDLPAFAVDALPETLRRYRESLVSPPEASFFTVKDAARELGSGVASWPRVRALVLVRGPSDSPGDDVILEVKELSESGIAGVGAPGVSANEVAARVQAATGFAWARRDAAPLWGTSAWAGLPVQIREKTEGQKSVRVARMTGDRGTKAAWLGLAASLGGLVARVHGTDRTAARAVRERIGGDVEAFVDELADFALEYGQWLSADTVRFAQALARLGPRLGVPIDAKDHPRGDFAMVLGAVPTEEK